MHTEISNKPYQIFNRDIIKYIAMFTMLLNHIATIFYHPAHGYVNLSLLLDTLPQLP